MVCGLGTIGLLTTMFLRQAGYTKVRVIGNKDIQKKIFLDMGGAADCFCDVRYEDPRKFVEKSTDGRGADFYFECIGRPENYEQAVKRVAPLGKVVLVGNPAADMELSRDAYWNILRKQMTLVGTWNSTYYGRAGKENPQAKDDWQYAINSIVTWDFPVDKLVSHCFSLAQMDIGLDIMKRKSEDYVKIMVKMV